MAVDAVSQAKSSIPERAAPPHNFDRPHAQCVWIDVASARQSRRSHGSCSAAAVPADVEGRPSGSKGGNAPAPQIQVGRLHAAQQSLDV